MAATEVSIGTISTHFAVTNPGGNVTASSIVEPTPIGDGTDPPAMSGGVPTGVTNAGDGVFRLGAGGSIANSAVMIAPFGVGADGTTFLMNVYGWFPVNPLLSGTFPGFILWTPILLCSFNTITLDSTQTGVNSTQVTKSSPTNYFCRAISLVTGNAGTSVEVVSPGGTIHEIAHVVVSTKGAKYIETRYSTGSSATSCNALIRGM